MFDFDHCPQCRGTLAMRDGVRALAEDRIERKASAGVVAKDALTSGYAGVGAAVNWFTHEAGAVVVPDPNGTVELRAAGIDRYLGFLLTGFGVFLLASYWLDRWEAGTRVYQVALLAAVFLIPGLLLLLRWRRARILLTPTGIVQRRALGACQALQWDQIQDVSSSWWNLVLHGTRGEKVKLSCGYVGFITVLDYLAPHARSDRARRTIDSMRRTL